EEAHPCREQVDDALPDPLERLGAGDGRLERFEIAGVKWARWRRGIVGLGQDLQLVLRWRRGVAITFGHGVLPCACHLRRRVAGDPRRRLPASFEGICVPA